MTVMNYEVLKCPGFNIDVAVFLAEASQAAYAEDTNPTDWCNSVNLTLHNEFNKGNIQGFWCSGDDVALLVFRGTSNIGQWLRDARLFPAPYPWGKVHVGFRSGIEAVEIDLLGFDEKAKSSSHIWITGHSLGGALGVIAAARLKIKGLSSSLYTYGQPRVGLGEFADNFNKQIPGGLIRIVNKSDIVTRVPPDPFFRHTGQVKRIIGSGALERNTFIPASNLHPTSDVSFERLECLYKVIGNQSSLESNIPSFDIHNGVGLDDQDNIPLTPQEFAELQFGLGAEGDAYLGPSAMPGFDRRALEGNFAPFADHSISKYIAALKQLQTSPL